MRVMINLRISPFLLKSASVPLLEQIGENIFFLKEVERGQSELLRGYCRHDVEVQEQDFCSQEGQGSREQLIHEGTSYWPTC